MATEKEIGYKLKLKDGTSTTLKRVKKNVKAVNKSFGKLTTSLTKMTIIGTGVSRSLKSINRAGKAMVDDTLGRFIKFEKSMAEVHTITNLTTEEMKGLGKEVQAFSRKYAVDANDAARALYQTISAGADSTNGAAEAMDIMSVSLKFGKAALVGAEDSVRLLMVILNSYNLEVADAARVSDTLFTLIKNGVTTGQELAGSLGRVTKIAATAGVSFDDLAAAMALLTKNGLSTDEAVTSLRALMLAIVNPGKQAKDAIKELGLSMFNEKTLKSEGGLFKVLKQLNEEAGSSVGKLAKVLPNVRALVGALAAAGDEQAIVTLLGDMKESAGAAEVALGKMTNTFGFKVEQLFAKMDSLKTRIGEIFASSDVLRGVFESVSKGIDDMITSLDDGGLAVSKIGTFIDEFITVTVPLMMQGLALFADAIGGAVRIISELINKQGPLEHLSKSMQIAFGLVTGVTKEYTAAQKAADEQNADSHGTMLLLADGASSLADSWRRAAFDLANAAAVAKAKGITDRAHAAETERQVFMTETFITAQQNLKNVFVDSLKASMELRKEAAKNAVALEAQTLSADEMATAWGKIKKRIGPVIKALSDSGGMVKSLLDSAAASKVVAVNTTMIEQAYKRIVGFMTKVRDLAYSQLSAEAQLANEARIIARLAAVESESATELLSIRERIRAEEQARSSAIRDGLPNVERYVELSMQNYDAAVLLNEQERERVMTIEERIAAEEEALTVYENSIESMVSASVDGFAEIFESFASGQASISEGIKAFGTSMKAQLSAAFLEPLIGAESFMSGLFKGLFDWASMLGKALADTIKGWFAEKATQRALDATVGAGTHAASASKTAYTTQLSVAAMMPSLSAAAAAALISTFGGAASAAALLPGLLSSASAVGTSFAAFAEGGRITSPTLALMGEAGHETIIPETRTGRARDVLADLAGRRPELFAGLGGGGGGGGSVVSSNTFNISVSGGGDDETLAEIIADKIDNILGGRLS